MNRLEQGTQVKIMDQPALMMLRMAALLLLVLMSGTGKRGKQPDMFFFVAFFNSVSSNYDAKLLFGAVCVTSNFVFCGIQKDCIPQKTAIKK